MAIDGAMLSLLRLELEKELEGSKMDKIQQPSREELVLVMRNKSGAHRLLISVRAACPRINLIPESIENPAQPPMFCMLLRKRLGSARFAGIRQQGMDRVLMLDFDAMSELGDRRRFTFVVELMGRCSNAILIDEDMRVVDSIKRVDGAMSSARMILPGITYAPPPQQNKLSIMEAGAEEICERIFLSGNQSLDKAVLSAVEGISPIIAREIAFKVCPGGDVAAESLSLMQRMSLRLSIEALRDSILSGGEPCMIFENERAFDVCFLRPRQYGERAEVKSFSSYSALLEAFCRSRDTTERTKVREHELLKLLANASDRTARKLAIQRKELEAARDRDKQRLYGDLISANIYRLNKGDSFCELENYESPDNGLVRIAMDARLTPSQNAQAYYREYRKAQTAEAHLIPLIEQGERELLYIDAVFDSLSRASSAAETAEIKAELADGGYIRGQSAATKKKPAPMPPKRYRSDDGCEILSGRNNRQNDRLTLKEAAKNDIWLHAAKMPGSHVIIKTGDGQVSDKTIEQAAVIAAFNSRGATQGLVPVDYTRVKNVTRMPGGKPGLVNYVEYKTVFVRPDEALCDRLSVK